jgi:hypothetical protein
MPGRGFRPSALRLPSRFPYRREDRFFVWLDVSATEFSKNPTLPGDRQRRTAKAKEAAAKRRRRRAR